MNYVRNKENNNPNTRSRVKKLETKRKCKRRLMFPNRNNEHEMAPVPNRRESISFDAILDNTNPEKLVQLIREKRGLQNAKRIFSESVSTKENNRKSFPFEVHTNNKQPTQNGGSTETTNTKTVDENSSNASNVRVGNVLKSKVEKKSNGTENTDRGGVGVEEEENKKRVLQSRIPLKPNCLGRRVLLKTFEKIQQEDGFHPTVASTPVQRNPPDEEYGSIISNINRCSSDENSPNNVRPAIEKGKGAEEPTKKSTKVPSTTNEPHPKNHISPSNHIVADESNLAKVNLPNKPATIQDKQRNSNKTDTIQQAKTIGESLMCQSPEVDKEDREKDDNGGRNTQFYHECIEVDETLVGNNSFKDVLTQEGENENSGIEQTLVNEMCEGRVDAHSPTHSHSTRPSLKPQTTEKHIQSTIVEGPKQNNADRSRKNSSVTHKSCSITNRPSQTTKSQSREVASINATSRKSESQIVSAIASRIRNSSYLAPPTPFRTERTDHKSNGVSFTIPASQSPQIHVTYPTSSVVVLPIYPQSHPKSTEHLVRQTTNESRRSNVDNPKVQKEVLPHQKEKSSTSDSAAKRISVKRKHSSVRRHPSSAHSIQRPESPDITSDEGGVEQGHFRDTQTDSRPSRRPSTEPSGVIDLRIPSRRSINYKLLKNRLSRSVLVESALNNSERTMLGATPPSDSEASLHKILRIDDLLKRINNSPESTNAESNDNNLPQPKVWEVTCNRRSRTIRRDDSPGQISDELDENIIEPVHHEDTRGGYVYDISPRLGKLYMNSMFKHGKTRETNVDTRRRPRQKSSKPVRLSQAVTYNDVESSMQRFIKYKRSDKSFRRSRRKLYSKGNSDAENSSEDETQPFESQTLINETNTTMSRAYVMDKKSKIGKCRCRPDHAKLLTIEDMKQMWCHLDEPQPTKRAKRPTEAPRMMSDDDELLFKVPQAVPMRRKVVRTIPMNVHIGSNIKNILGAVHDAVRNQHQHIDGGHGDSSSSDENSEQLSNSGRIDNLAQVTRGLKNSVVKLSRRSHHVNNARVEAHDRTQVSQVSCGDLSTTREKNIGEKLPAIDEVSGIETNNCDEVESQQNVPVEPGQRENSLYTSFSNNQSGRQSKHSTANESRIHNRTQSKLQESLQNGSVASSNRTSKGQTSNKNNRAYKPRQDDRDIEVTPLRKELESSPSKKSRRDVDMTPIQRNQLADTFSAIDKETVTKKHVKKKTSNKKSVTVDETQRNQGLVEESTTDLCVPSVRRSTRKHRPPRPYWTNQYSEVEQREISYKDHYVAGKKRRKQQSKLPSVDEDPKVDSHVDLETPQNLVENLFDVIKEMSLNYQKPDENKNPTPESETAVQPPAKKLRKQRKTSRNVNTKEKGENPNPRNAIEEHILTDSGHGTDSNGEQNQQQPQNLLLSWLKNLVEPQTISSNPDLVQIFHMSDVRIVPVTNLVFETLEGVEYAYYSQSNDGENYGYMRFHPKSAKKRARTKLFELRLLCVVGTLTLRIENEAGTLKNGDFVSVPKGILYSIANHSDEFALLFFIRK